MIAACFFFSVFDHSVLKKARACWLVVALCEAVGNQRLCSEMVFTVCVCSFFCPC